MAFEDMDMTTIEHLDPDKEFARLTSLRGLEILDTPIDNRFERVTRLVQNVLKVPIASFNLVDKERQWSKSIQGLSVVEIARKQSFCSHVIQGDRMMVVNDARSDDRFAENPLVTGNPHIVFYAGCPVHAPDGERIGALCAIDRQVRELSAKEAQILRDLAGVLESELRLDQMSKTVEGLERRLDTAERLALIDPLTRLWNRAGVIEALKRAWSQGARSGQPVAVVIADLDHFKQVNDRHGQAAGDDVLREMAKILSSTLRADDTIGRLGGEEFMIVMPGCPPERLMETAERIRRETLISDIETEAGRIDVTVSFGAASMIPDAGADMTDLMEVADDALSEAKRTGRNKVVVRTGRDASAAA